MALDLYVREDIERGIRATLIMALAVHMAGCGNQQDKEMDALIERMGWHVLAEFVDTRRR